MSFLKLTLTLAVIGLVLYEGVAVAVNQVQTDDLAQRALLAVERAGGPGSVAQATDPEEAAQAVVDAHPRATLDLVVVERDHRAVTVTQTARVVVIDGIGPLADLAVATVSKESSGP